MNTQPSDSKPVGRDYWMSFEHLVDSPEIAEAVEKEFSNYDPDELLGMSRRRFLKYITASLALAGVGLTGCRRWPEEVVAPYSSAPKDRTPGVPEYYATSWELAGVGCGLLAQSYEGRPIKIEGNPSHPANVVRSGQWGATDAISQAQTLSLYDPDRSRAVVDSRGGQPQGRTIDWFRENVIPALQAYRGNGSRMAVLSEATASPTLLRLREQLVAEFPGLKWYTWEPLGTPAAVRAVYTLAKAKTIVSIDEDYLGHHPASVRYNADWAATRASADGERPQMSRCYAAECRYSLTGAASDMRLPVKPSRLGVILGGIAQRVGVSGAGDVELFEKEAAFVDAAARDLQEAGESGLVACGDHLPAALRQLALQINTQLGSVGTTHYYIENPVPQAGDLPTLCQRIDGGEVESLVILGGNPVYDAPANLNFASLLAKVPTSVHLSLYRDETSNLCTFHVPRAHFLEAWGDTRSWDGTIAPIQPLILPLFGGLSSIELVAQVLGLEQADGLSLVKATMAGLIGDESEKAFRQVLHDGVVPNSASQPTQAGEIAGDGPEIVAGEGFEITFAGDPFLFDGRFANNGWLQEAPETMTKLTWDNAALMSIFDAEELGVRTKDVISLTVNGREMELPVYVMPGQPRGVIGLTLGYGRTSAGAIGNAQVNGDGGGFDTYRLRTTDAMWYAAGASAKKTGGKYVLAMTQNHHLIDKVGYEGRAARVGEKGQTSAIIREALFPEHQAFVEKTHAGTGSHALHPAMKGQHGAVTLQIFEPPSEFNQPHAWGMSIDMNACTGCGACVLACQSENNIPTVGKNMVLNNREMHWLRIDRYFKSGGETYEEQIHDENPDVAMQPMMCVHCENAPCEQVCPVAATVHDTEGLNTMVYNRCIGTRYCSNNCPYKVRRFNYLDFHYKDPRGSVFSATFPGLPDQQQDQINGIKRMVFNPEVTVRMRGVMEKCTYCTQRIQAKKIWRSNQGEPIHDGDIKTACQMACPTEAIIFGNLLDAEARATRQQQNPRSYAVLADLNTRPRTKYMAKLRNRPLPPTESGNGEAEAH